MTQNWTKLENILRDLIKNSRRPDYIDHAETTRSWLLKLKPNSSEEMKIAAFAHDIERCFSVRMSIVENEDYLNYKNRHAQRCADILAGIMIGLEFDSTSIKTVYHLVSLHEVGGDVESDLIRDADSLSFMSNNLPRYLSKNGRDAAKEKVKYMYDRASEKAKELIDSIEFSDELKSIVESAVNSLSRSACYK